MNIKNKLKIILLCAVILLKYSVAISADTTDETLWTKFKVAVSNGEITKISGKEIHSAVFIEGVPMVKQVEGLTSLSAAGASVVRFLDEKDELNAGLSLGSMAAQQWLEKLSSEEGKSEALKKYYARKKELSKINSLYLQRSGEFLTVGVHIGRMLEDHVKKSGGNIFLGVKSYALERGFDVSGSQVDSVSVDTLINSLNDKHPVILFDDKNAYVVLGYFMVDGRSKFCVMVPDRVKFEELPRESFVQDEKLKVVMREIDKMHGLKKMDRHSELVTAPQDNITFLEMTKHYHGVMLNGFSVSEKSVANFIAE